MICDTCDTDFVCADNRKRSICDTCIAFLVRQAMPKKLERRDRREAYYDNTGVLWSKMIDKLREHKLSKVIDSKCWLMNGRDPFKYQSVSYKGESYSVHLVSLVKKLYRPIKEGYEGDHLCYVKGCFNPDHIEEVTKAENGRRAATPGHSPYTPYIKNIVKRKKKGSGEKTTGVFFKSSALGFEYGKVLKKKLP